MSLDQVVRLFFLERLDCLTPRSIHFLAKKGKHVMRAPSYMLSSQRRIQYMKTNAPNRKHFLFHTTSAMRIEEEEDWQIDSGRIFGRA